MLDLISFLILFAVAWLAAKPSRFPGIVVFFSRPFSPRLQAWLFQESQRFVDGLGALRSSKAVAQALMLAVAVRLVGMLTN